MSKTKVVTIIIVLICIIMLVCLLLPTIAILGESMLVRIDIRNPYVNNGFRGWDNVQIEDFEPFLIPKEWSLEEESGIYKIIDNTDKVWAFGVVWGTEEAEFDSYKDLIATVYETSSDIEIITEPFIQSVMMDGSSIGLLRIDGDIANNTLFCMNLFEEPQKQLVWILTSDLSLDEIQFNIAEAIVYSFAFAVKIR